MLFFAILLSCLPAAQAPPPKPDAPKAEAPKYKPDELCTLEGIVRNAVTGEPLKKANITASSTSPQNQQPPATTATDADGKFAMKELEPGQYRLSAQRQGFVAMAYGARPGTTMGGTTLTLEKGQSIKTIEFKLPPHAVITGRVVDQDGDPVQGASVMLVRPRYMQGRKQMMPSGGSSTNDLGEYRMFGIAAGKYYLSVVMRNSMMYGVDRSANAAPDEGYAATYFPGTNDLASASQITVPLGGMMQGIDVTLRRMRTHRIKGKVVGARGNRGGMVMVSSKEGSDSIMDQNFSSWRGPSGDFEIRGIRPGSYVVTAQYAEPPDIRFVGRIPVEVSDRDVADVVVQLGSGIEVQGSVRTEGEKPVNLDDITVSLTVKNQGAMMFANNSARVTEGGVFKIPRVSPDEYILRVTGAPPEYYLKSARMGDTDVLENGLDLTQVNSVSGFDVVLSPGAAKLSGSVIDAKENPVRGAMLVLRPSKVKPALVPLLTKTATSDQNGQYQFEGITPGEYHVLSFEGLDMFEVQDPEVFKENESSAIRIELKEKAQETKQLKVIPRKD